jgi:hypothetical protein
VKTGSLSSTLRAFLALCRVPSLPTIWSNCLAGWWLGGGRNPSALPLLLVGATFCYLGGAFLNDVFDANYDRQYRRTRPIPSGAISREAVLRWGLVWLAASVLAFFCLGLATGGLGLLLIACILLYNAIHRWLTSSPVLVGLSRLLLYLIAASTAPQGVTGWSIWCGLAMAAYFASVCCVARWENAPEPPSYWCLVPIAIPILLALLMDAGPYRESGWLLVAVLGLWMIRCLRPVFAPGPRQVGRIVEGLTAGIVFVDWLAAADVTREMSFVFIGLFLTTLVLQRLGRVA